MTTQAVVVVTAYMRGNMRPQLHFSSPRVRDLLEQLNAATQYNVMPPLAGFNSELSRHLLHCVAATQDLLPVYINL
jgi:hypothetical protein